MAVIAFIGSNKGKQSDIRLLLAALAIRSKNDSPGMRPYWRRKTTYAHEIAGKYNAIRFSEDEWLSKLFIPDAPENLLSEPMQFVGEWAGEKYQRCRGQIWLICQQLLKQNVNIVLDGAAANKEQRDLIRKKAYDNNVGFQLHYVTSDPETREKRVFDRNQEQGVTYSIGVTPAMLAMFDLSVEPCTKLQ